MAISTQRARCNPEMADKSGIVWTNATWNPVTGCSKVSQGCKNCYAERDWGRLTHLPAYAGRQFTDVACHAERLDQPLRWAKPRMIFVNSMSDLFHPDVPEEFIDRMFAVMALAKQHAFQVLTKRPERMSKYLTTNNRQSFWAHAANEIGLKSNVPDHRFPGQKRSSVCTDETPNPLPNVWLGISVEDQAAADERIPLLLQTPAAVRWISAEPLLGPVDLRKAFMPDGERPVLDWVVVGGESGPNARPMHPDWARALREQCQRAGVPFFFKQTGVWQALKPGEAGKAEFHDKTTRFQWNTTFVKTRGGGSDLLDGRQWQEWPR